MGWRFKWLSSHGNSFNYDFRVSFTPEEVAKGELRYNYGTWPHAFEEWPGISVFWKDEAGDVFHTYSTYGRGVGSDGESARSRRVARARWLRR